MTHHRYYNPHGDTMQTKKRVFPFHFLPIFFAVFVRTYFCDLLKIYGKRYIIYAVEQSVPERYGSSFTDIPGTVPCREKDEEDIMENFIMSTLIPAESSPPAFGLFHIIVVLIGLPLVFILAWKMRKTDHRKADRILFVIAVVLLLAEIYKQFVFYYGVNEKSSFLTVFPFYICSMPMYFGLVIPFLKRKRPLFCFLELFTFMTGLAAFIEPSGLFNQKYWNSIIHSVIWHLVIMFIGAYIMFSGRGTRNHKDYLSAVIVFLSLSVVAFISNVLLEDPSHGMVNNFFVGPTRNPLIIFSTIWENHGWVLCLIAYIPTLCAGAYAVFQVIRLVRYIASKKKKA